MNIIYFDGVCGMCNFFVDFIMKRDKTNLFLYAPLQGETAKVKLGITALSKLDSVYFQKGDKIYKKSTAALEIFWMLGGLWRLTIIGRIFPAFIRDLIYDLIASNRYRLFGKKDECRIPSPAERKKFLP